MIPLLRRIYSYLYSPLLAIIVISAIAFASLVGALLDSTIAIQWLGMESSNLVFKSNWFLVLNLIFLLMTTACTFRQITVNYKRWKKLTVTPGPQDWANQNQHSNISQYLSGKGYKYNPNTNGTVWYKNSIGLIGSPLFHFGLMVVVMGVLIDVFAGFSGSLVFQPGETVVDSPENYITMDQRQLYPGTHGQMQITLQDIKFEYHHDGVGSSGFFSVLSNNQKDEGVVDRDVQLDIGLLSLTRENHGYYAYYQNYDRFGRLTNDHALGLNTEQGESGVVYQRSGYRDERTPYQFDIQFFPDVISERNAYKTKSYERKNPAIFLTMKQGTEEVFKGLVKIGQEVTLTNGEKFIFRGVNPYLLIRVQWMLGIYTVTVGFIIFMIGLVLYYAYPLLTVKIIQQEGRYKLRSEGFSDDDEFRNQLHQLEKSLNDKF